jgi:hypothetical protein
MGKPAKVTQGKRNREHAQRMKRKDKEERRVQRKAEKADRPPPIEGEDPDLVGLRLGPQPPLY